MNTPRGCIIFFINVTEDFRSICILKIFRPQLDEPEQPPINIINKNNVIYHEINAHINDQAFVDKALEILDDWIEKGIVSK